ncbi:non-ribosomal peptide synthase/polyketide synthase [Phytopseudomonas dryadis]|uniref:Non-ribosomal peptide synthetase n=1 Tax=Phytopseudomonas dryadis TaxID=2487520 RepID=A0A4Q9QVJ2_9GAMM|nr:non-ribosomal peptide synthase/polyketide synthase [Pseudomonas dryadis]TBU87893.1 non-ribosomal peptide synthetase [Pseudomonas dryadis]
MNAEDALKLARRFIELPLEKRRLFLQGLQQEGVDFSLFPIPTKVVSGERDGLSYAQRRMWFLWQLDPHSAAYNLPMAVRLNGNLDPAALQRAFDGLVARHETLRSLFHEQDGQVRQQIAEPFSVTLVSHDLTTLAADDRELQVRALADAEALAPFDLAQGPLMRVQLLKLADQEHVLLLTLHHIVADGWSYNVLIDEFIHLYDAACDGSEAPLQPLPIQYRDYALWQRSWLEAGEQERQLDYWRSKLGDDHAPLELPVDHPRPLSPSYRGARHEFQVDPALAERLRSLAREQGVTLFMALLAAFKVLLHRYSGQQAIRVGVPVANRNRTEVEGLIGCFINTQVLHTEIDPLIDVGELLRRVKDTTLGAQGHQELPFERLVEALGLDRSLSVSPLFQVLYNHQSQVADAAVIKGQSGLSLAALERETRIAQFDLSLDTYEQGGKLFAAFGYATDLFDSRTVERMAGHYGNLLEALAEGSGKRIGELAMLNDVQRQQILHDWNATQTDYPLDRCVHQLIEAQVERAPQAPALAFGSQTLSYAELNTRANRLAHYMIELGVPPDGLVGIAVERSIEMVVGLLAILKAGGAYVPLDPEYPSERLAYMLEDSVVQLLLSQSYLELPLAEGVQRIDLDQDSDWLEEHDETNPEVLLTGEQLAYVIYTSGSTGKPKGAGNRHSALTNRLCWMQEAYGLDDSDTVMQKTPFSFDVSVWEFFWPLMTGARLVVAAPGDHRDPAKLVELIEREGVTTLHFVPSMLQAFLQDPTVASCASLKRIVCSGEALPADAQQQVFARLPQANLYNLYGPTEAAIDVTHWTCVEEGRDAVPIGKPIANLGCHILDSDLQPVPVGVLGELYLLGEGLARGYHQRPALTAERFVASPFGDGARLYRTGDLARYRADGVIEYAGRIDHQVKLRGLRIELGEIEARLLEHEWVREAAVLAVDGKQLVGYVVLADETDGWRETLAAHLAPSLPEYMVPTQWIDLAQMPLSPNGKLDRKALPRPDASTAQNEYVAPQNELEQRIAEIWQDVLKREHVGRHDNFFELGGDSIVSIQVVSRARQAGIQFTPKDLFQHQTVRSLAAVAEVGSEVRIDQGAVIGEVLLTPVQHWFFEQDIARPQHWNQSLLLEPRKPLDAAQLEAAVARLIEQHDALRLRFEASGQGWKQVHAALPLEAPVWHRHAASVEALEGICDEAQRSLDLSQGPMLRVVLVDMHDGSQRLLLAIHHLVVDGVSWRILLEDLQGLLRQAETGAAFALPAKTSSYQAWAERLQGYAGDSALADELDYWRQALADAPADLPCDNPEGSLRNAQEQKVTLTLDTESTRQLLQEAPGAYRTQVGDLLLTALARVVTRWSGAESALIQLEGHGREELFEGIDLTRTVGWFTSMFPVRLTPQADLPGSIKMIKEQLRAVPGKGLGFGVLRYLGDAGVQAELAALPQPRITFNYLGQFDGQFDHKALFVPAAESPGRAQDEQTPLANWLSIEGQVYSGELTLQWSFSQAMFAEATVQRLVEDYRQELAALIEHCREPGNSGLTPSDFPLANLDQGQLDDLPIAAGQVEDIYPLSPMQQGMLFHTLYGQEGTDYVNQMRLDVEGLDVERFRAAWQATLGAHDVLRTALFWQREQPLQVVLRQVALPFEVLDWRGRANCDEALDALAERERLRGFDLARAPLLRLVLVSTDEQRHHLIYTHHHILMDGWSNAQVLGEVLQRYAGQEPERFSGRYYDYIAWLQDRDAQTGEGFWKKQLAELSEPTRLVQAGRSEVENGQRYGEHLQVFGSEQTGRLKHFAQRHKVTLNTLLQAGWLLLLQRYTRQDCVAFGATVAGRPAELRGIERQVGLFINTLPVIARPRPEQRVGEWLQAVQQLNLALREYEHTPLYDVQRWAGLSGEALFDSLLVFENYPVAEVLQGSAPGGLRFAEVKTREQTNYPLTLVVGLGNTLSVQFLYTRSGFDAQVIERMAGHFGNLLRALADDGEARIGELAMLDGTERRQLIHDWNCNQAEYPHERCIHQLIETQVESTPGATALIFAGLQFTYEELNVRANRLAHRLREAGVGPDVRVGIALERTPELVVGLLAVLKAGGAYVPLDPQYPRERLAYMLEDSRALLLLSQSSLLERLPEGFRDGAMLLDRLELDAYPSDNPVAWTVSGNLAYSIYTSGSTGRPKGVLIEHRNAAALVGWARSVYDRESLQGVLASTSICFDLSVWELFVTLATGGYVVLADNALELPRLDARGQVRLVNTVPSAIKALCESGQLPESVRTINLAGEPLQQSLVDELYRLGHVQRVYDLYGPSEDTTYSTWTLRTPAGKANIGRPIANTCSYLLDEAGQPMPVGGVGELCLTGAGLARGYLGQPALTAEKFLPDPFDDQGGGRLYRTGDLARYRTDGVIEYVGRIDHQVKIRGFRIELGEIEAQLLKQESVREAAVLAQDGMGGKQLVAYLVPAEAGVLGDAETETTLRQGLRAKLKAALPDYMVPSQLLLLDKLPLTPNGKLDRKALPMPDASQSQQAYVAPRTELEQQISAIWSQVLRVESVGLSDHFFELGGHSLLATQVISRVRQALEIELPLRDLFEAPRLADFVARIEQGVGASAPPLVRVERDKPLVLSYAQQRQWFLWQLEPASAAYHIPTALRLKGELDIEALQRSFERLIERHETLRTSFRQDGEQTIQVIHPAGEFDLSLQTVDDLDEQTIRAKVEEEIQRPFDLEHGPLLRVKLLRLASDDHVLVLTLHHIVSDGWSMPVMVDELISLYEGYRQGQSVELPVLPIQYADYAIWQRNWMEAGERERQLSYWKAQLGDEQPVLELPTDRPRPAVQSHAGASLNIELSDELSQSLKRLAQEQGVTLFMLLLASFQTLLHRYSGQDDIRVGVPIANRNRVETEGLIGFFVNTQVLRAEFDLQMTFGELLEQVKQAALGAQAHQDLPFEQLVEALQPERSLSHSPLFQVMYNHQSEARGDARQLPGLRVEGLAWDNPTTQFDLMLDTCEYEGGLGVSLSYATELFERATAERLMTHWRTLLQGLVENVEQRIAELPLLDEGEQRQLILAWNHTQASYPSEVCIHQLIEAQVNRAPEAAALTFGEQTLSYGELNRRANRLAHKLRELGVGPDVLVGIAVERSLEMVVGLLGILKAGGAYVPLDPEYPQDRLAYMMEDSRIGLLLTQGHLASSLPVPENVTCLALEAGEEWLSGYGESNLGHLAQPENLAYVIYTSGSTGRPKGAGNTHRALVNRLYWMQKAYGLVAGDRVLQKTPFSFDVSVWEFFWPLMSGARLIVAQPGEHRDPQRLIETIDRHAVTTLHFVPSMLQIFLAGERLEGCRSIKRVICSGEALPAELARKALERLPGAGVFNLYGPTEAAIDVTQWTCTGEEEVGVPIGRPIDNLKTHILGAGLLPAVQGSAGELYLGGVGLARGYHARPALTAERFIPDPFDEQGGGRLYRTGDLARYRADGVIEYVGRIDHQVKIRGFRIELGEIEAKLLEDSTIREAVVLAQEGPAGKQLVAYLVPAGELTEAQGQAMRTSLRERLKAVLPDYMVPTYLLLLDALPVTANGKLDRRALPVPDAGDNQQAYVAPSTELEQKVAAIWAEVLKIQRVGLADNFFDLGGNSLLVLSVLSRLQLLLGLKIEPSMLFKNPTLAEFSRQLDGTGISEFDEKLLRLDMFADELEVTE